MQLTKVKVGSKWLLCDLRYFHAQAEQRGSRFQQDESNNEIMSRSAVWAAGLLPFAL